MHTTPYEKGNKIELTKSGDKKDSLSVTIRSLKSENPLCREYFAHDEYGIEVLLKEFCFESKESESGEGGSYKERTISAYNEQFKLMGAALSADKGFPLFGLCEDEAGNVYSFLRDIAGENFSSACKRYNLAGRINMIFDIAQLMNAFHRDGWLLFDINPENIIIRDLSGNDGIYFKDFDSFVTKEEIRHAEKENEQFKFYISSPFSAPELMTEQVNLSKINERCDRYSIGALMYYAVFGRAPKKEDGAPNKIYDFTSTEAENLSDDAKDALSAFFRKTICANPVRYGSDAFMFSDLKVLMALISGDNILFFKNVPQFTDYFVGRSLELNELEIMLRDKKGPIFIEGESGCGKSELACHIAEKLSDEYLFMYVPFTGNVRNTLLSLPFKTLEYVDDDRLYEKLTELLKNKDEKTCIIVDDFDLGSESKTLEFLKSDEMQKLLSLPVRFIFTTQAGVKDYPSIEIGALEKEEADEYVKNILPTADKKTIENIISKCCANTLMLSIMAHTLSACRDKVPEDKTIDLKEVFSLARFSQGERLILSFACIFPENGIRAATLFSVTSKYINDINNLVRCGYLRYDKSLKRYSLHPDVKELCFLNKKTAPKKRKLKRFIYALEKMCVNSDEINKMLKK